MHQRPTVGFNAMKDGTAEDYALLAKLEQQFHKRLPARIMRELRELENSYAGYKVSRLEHSLISATLAVRDRADVDWVVAALLHDIGDCMAPMNHSQLASAILAPYVREECAWVLKTHGVFQMVYYAHHVGGDRNARDVYKLHPYYQTAVDFTERWDQCAFDPAYDYLPLEHFEPMVVEVFSRPPWDAEVVRKGERVPLVGSAAIAA